MSGIFKCSLLFVLLTGCFISSKAQFGALPPYTIQIEPISGITMPGIHSFAFAQSGDKWLFIGGRTNGLHGINSNDGFLAENKNDAVIVVDTATWNFYSADLNQLPRTIADPMRSTNMEYIQEGKYLYMIGGYGYDSTLTHYLTFPTLTAINVDTMINAVMNALPIASSIRQVTDTNFAICGGELEKLGSDYYLLLGHNFAGRYDHVAGPLFTQVYSDRIKKFNIADNDTTITLSNFTYLTDTTNFHRRDFTSAPIVKPNGSFGIGVYGGVFQKNIDLPYLEPITIDAAGATVDMGYQQIMSQYTCAVLPIFDSLKQTMYTTFFGGISVNNYNDTTGLLVHDTLVPFINDVTTLTVNSFGVKSEAIMTQPLSGLLGSNAKFIPNGNLSHYSNDVVKINNIANHTQVLAGYMFGGIRANASNLGITTSNDSIYRIYLTPNYTLGIAESSMNITNTLLYPNPSIETTTLLFSMKNAEEVRVSITDITGKEVQLIANEKMNAGKHQLTINTSRLSAGMYTCNIGYTHFSLIVSH